MEQWRIAFSREHRQALRARRRALDDVLDRVAAVCFRVTAMRESGTVAPGAASYLAIEQEIGKLHGELSWPDAGVDIPLALGALHEITARCQNRYVS